MELTNTIKNSNFGLENILKLYSYTSQSSMQTINHKCEMPSLWLRGREQSPCLPAIPWVFEKGTKEQCQVFCCALWVMWNSRNQMVHERKFVSERDLVQKIQTYLAELKEVGKEKHTWKTVKIQRQMNERMQDIILFDASFDANRYKSASKIIVRDRRGEIRALKITLHSNISSSFLVEASACLVGNELICNEGCLQEEWAKNPD